jgi:hypothetical protein
MAVKRAQVATTAQPKRDRQAEQEAAEQKMLSDYLARKERDELLKRQFCI